MAIISSKATVDSLLLAVSSAYDRWQAIEQPASHVLEGRIARGRVWLGQYPNGTEKCSRADAEALQAQLRAELKLARWAENVDGSDEMGVVERWRAAQIEYEEAEERYLHALGGHRVTAD